ncbi:ervatamin-B-like [Daphnia pulicaria]|uniref:ervatamin-B-like n=1 Tax=Daphnia pulicaria TaxID=35523 RepID=UPI001EEBAFA7|nr:ervatamin-B-like [Daphnia pulicaria]
MKVLFVSVVLVIVIASIKGQSEATAEWKEYKTKNSKNYNEKIDGGKQEKMRKQFFLNKDAKIKKHNSGNSPFKMAHNKFSDRTEEELNQLLGTVLPPLTSKPRSLISKSDDHNDRKAIRIAASLDYRNHRCLAAVKNQRLCGSCWAFSAIAPLEFSKCLKTKRAVVLSEQQLVDCDTASTNMGCNGGWYAVAWEHLQKVGGSAREALYPYTAKKNTCNFCSKCACKIGAKVSSFDYVESKNATEMQIALTKYGPLAVAITVVGSFYSYSSGVYDDPACDGKDVNHGVVVVGWGVLNSMNYWIVRNTWGTSWGIGGYILMKRGVNKCSVETYPAYVVAE